MISAKKKSFVIYVRCSTEDQSRGDFTTLEVQEQFCNNTLNALGHKSVRVVKDDGFTAANLNRPGIQSILKEIQASNKQRTFDGIIVYRLDRLTRNPLDQYALMDLFNKNGVEFLSVQQHYDLNSADGEFRFGLDGLLSYRERRIIAERVRSAALARIREGKWPGGHAPYGYKTIDSGIISRDGRNLKKIVVDKEIGPKIKLIWELAAANKSLRTIGKELLKRGIATRRGKPWRVSSILHIMRNPFYCGDVRGSGEIHKGKHEPLIDRELWMRANKIFNAHIPGHRFAPKPKKYIYLVEGLLRCGQCGSYYITKYCLGHSEAFFYYICSRKNQGLGCDVQPLSATAFDQALVEYFRQSSREQRLIIQAMEQAVAEARANLKEADTAITKKEEKLKACREQAEKLLDLALQGTIAKGTTFKSKMEDIEDEMTLLETDLFRLKEQRKLAEECANSSNFLHSNLVVMMAQFDKEMPEAQKALFQALIKEITIHPDRIEMKIFVGQNPEESSPLTPTENPKAAQAVGSPECSSWLGELNAERTTQRPQIQLLVPMYRRRSRGFRLSLVGPFEARNTKGIVPKAGKGRQLLTSRD